MVLKGITIQLQVRNQIGTDAFSCPIYDTQYVDVENVLVAPASSTDIITATDLTGKKAVYTLAIPKGDMHDWNDCTVKFFGREWKSFGYPLEGIDALIPGEWNKKVLVELYG
jgi:hypothetical protein